MPGHRLRPERVDPKDKGVSLTIPRFLRKVAEFLRLSVQDKVLDFGCGTGLVTALLRVRCQTVVGCDNVVERLQKSRGRVGRSVACGASLPFRSGAFTKVLCFHVLEHLEPAEQQVLLAEFARVLTPGGKLFVGLPIFEALGKLIFVVRRFATGDRAIVDQFGATDHKVTYSRSQWRASLARAGFARSRRSLHNLILANALWPLSLPFLWLILRFPLVTDVLWEVELSNRAHSAREQTARSIRAQRVASAYADAARAEQLVLGGNRVRWHYMACKICSDWALLTTVDLRDKRVLNVGCSEPIDELYLARLVRTWVAVDTSLVQIRAARAIIRQELSEPVASRIRLVVADGASLPFKNAAFDVTVSFSTIEHIPERKRRNAAVNEMARATARDGFVAITVPNLFSLFPLVDLVRGLLGTKDYGYAHWYAPLELRRQMRSAGLVPVRFASELRLLNMPQALSWPLMRFGMRIGYLAEKRE